MAKKMKGPGEIKVSKQYAYLDLPKDMEECFYELELQEVKEIGEVGNIAFVWNVLDTDTRVKVGSEINLVLYPFQKLAHVYFWRELLSLQLVLRGKDVTQDNMDKVVPKAKKILKKFMDGEYNERSARLEIKSYNNEAGDAKTRRNWLVIGGKDDE
jgi:hypothetical protein